jgi:hypothetical protein
MAKPPLKLRAKEADKETPEAEVVLQPEAEIATAQAAPEARASNVPERHTQRRKTEPGRYWLQIDRQTKSSYDTAEAAAAAGLLIKKSFSMVQVAVYDRKEGSNQILELPA